MFDLIQALDLNSSHAWKPDLDLTDICGAVRTSWNRQENVQKHKEVHWVNALCFKSTSPTLPYAIINMKLSQ